MAKIGAPPKPPVFFENLTKYLDGKTELWVAYHDNTPVAALLLLKHNGIVDYYTPAIIEEFRSLQPLSLLIFTAMQHATKNNCKYWNWGGTAPGLSGVYRFKKRWATTDHPYNYYTVMCNDNLKQLSPQILQDAFPGFYSIPYSCLDQDK
jgi:hypothetical protein